MFRYYTLALGCLLYLSPSLQSQILFSEDFAGGLPDNWINRVEAGNTLASAAWQFTTTGPAGPLGGNPLNSLTADDGWMIFDSDLNCNAAGIQDAWLISPPIDASSAQIVWLLFSTYYASYNDEARIRIGSDLDALNDWAIIEAFPNVVANTFGGPDRRGDLNPYAPYFNLTPWLAGTSDQRIAFQFLSNSNTYNGGTDYITGCAYWWQIDDIAVIDYDPRPIYEMGINSFAAIAPNAMTPFCQVEPIHFLADVANKGQETPDSTILTIRVHNLAGEMVFTDQIVYGPIASDSIAENIFFEDSFLPPMAPDIYTATYSIDYPGIAEDGQPNNNTLTFDFQITTDIFAKEIGFTRSIAPASNPSYTYGNVFYVHQGQGKHIQEVSFAVDNADELLGRNATLLVAEWDGEHASSRYLAPEEYEIVGFSDYTFTGLEGRSRIYLPIRTIQDEPVVLQDSTYYIVAVQYNSSDDTTIELLASENYDYFATVFQTDSLDMPRYTSVLNIVGEDPINRFDLLGFGYDVVPTIRMTIEECEPVRANDLPPSTELVKVYPNPVLKHLIIDNQSNTPYTWIRLYNLQGQLLRQVHPEFIKQTPYAMDLGLLPAGSYLLDIRSSHTRQSVLIQKQ